MSSSGRLMKSEVFISKKPGIKTDSNRSKKALPFVKYKLSVISFHHQTANLNLLNVILAFHFCLRPHQHYAGGIWKQSFISLVRPSIHTNPEKLSTKKGAPQRRSWKQRNLEMELCVLVWTDILKTKLFLNDDVTIIRCFVCLSLPHWRPKLWLPCWFRHVGSTKTLLWTCSQVHSNVSVACDCCVFKFFRHSVDGKHFIHFLVWMKNIWCVFRVKLLFSNSSSVVWTGTKLLGKTSIVKLNWYFWNVK